MGLNGGEGRDINFSEMQPIRTAAQADKHYAEPPPAPLSDPAELSSWPFYRAGMAEYLPLPLTTLTLAGVVKCSTAWPLGGVIFAVAYFTGGISGGHINPAVTFGLFLARKLSLARALFCMVMQCLGAICGAGVAKGFQKEVHENNGGGASVVTDGYAKVNGLGAEILATFVLVYILFSATDAKMRSASDSRVPVS